MRKTGLWAAGLSLALALALAGSSVAEDLLFPFNMTNEEIKHIASLGLTAHTCGSAQEWYGMTTADFAKYKALVIPDPFCGTNISRVQFLEDTKHVWSPAVQGNVVLIGTDPSYHYRRHPGAGDLMRDAIAFAASTKNGSTGMYFSLSCYYGSIPTSTVAVLSDLGDFTVQGRLLCYNAAHLVARTGAPTANVTDAGLSNWGCSVHEAFTAYPRSGPAAFNALAIALNATGDGRQTFGDGTFGVPYVIARGVKPLGCGDNLTQPDLGEECDHGEANGTPGDLCSDSCQCLTGVAGPGLCRLNNNTSSSSMIMSTGSALFANSTAVPSPVATAPFANSSTATQLNSTLPISAPSTLPPQETGTATGTSTLAPGAPGVSSSPDQSAQSPGPTVLSAPANNPDSSAPANVPDSSTPANVPDSSATVGTDVPTPWSAPGYGFPPPPETTPSSDPNTPVRANSSPVVGIVMMPPTRSDECDIYVGIEVIVMVAMMETSSEGATSTNTEVVATMTRPICHTSTAGLPCYPCIMGSPSPGDTATVTVTSCPSVTDTAATVTVQMCSTCPTTTYTPTQMPGFTPGGPCLHCTSYTSDSESSTDVGPPVATTVSSEPDESSSPVVTAGGSARSAGLVFSTIVLAAVGCALLGGTV